MIPTIVITSLTCIILILSILFFPKIKFGKFELNTYWVISFIGVVLLITFKLIEINEIYISLTKNTAINPIKILILFFSMTLLSIYLDEVGFFKYLATRESALAKSNQKILFIILYVLVSILTIFTSNDIVILTFTPFVCYFCKNTDIDPIPFLVGEFAAANTWSMMLIIGNPTNIYLATATGITFIDYLKVMILPTICAGIVEVLIIYLLFKKKLSKPMKQSFEKNELPNKPKLILGLIHLGVCLILLIISSYINLEMWLVSFACAISLLLWITFSNIVHKHNFSNLKATMKRLPWELIPFVLSMFIIVGCLNKQGISEAISRLLGENKIILTYGVTSFITCNLINNIPMSVLFSNLPVMESNIKVLEAIFSTIIGSNIGAFLTPIGALAGIMFTGLLSKYKVKYGFISFIRYGVIIAIPTLITALFILKLII